MMELFKYQAMELLQEAIFGDIFNEIVYKLKRSETLKTWIKTIYDKENPIILMENMNVN